MNLLSRSRYDACLFKEQCAELVAPGPEGRALTRSSLSNPGSRTMAFRPLLSRGTNRRADDVLCFSARAAELEETARAETGEGGSAESRSATCQPRWTRTRLELRATTSSIRACRTWRLSWRNFAPTDGDDVVFTVVLQIKGGGYDPSDPAHTHQPLYQVELFSSGLSSRSVITKSWALGQSQLLFLLKWPFFVTIELATPQW